MAGRSLLPFFSRKWSLSRPNEDTDPFMAFRREMNRVFDDTFRGFGMPSLLGPAFGRMPMETLMPQIDVSESEHEIQVTAELPGIDEKDVEVILADDMLTIRRREESRARAEGPRLSPDGAFPRHLFSFATVAICRRSEPGEGCI